MAEAVVQNRRPGPRFFCHRCNIEFEDVLQEFICPHCSTGFIERLEHDETLSSTMDEEEYSDADMSNLEEASIDDSDDPIQPTTAQEQPMLNDLAFLMTGGRLRRPGGGGQRSEGRSLLEQLVWMIGGGRGAVTTAGAPFVLVGAPGDYVFGGEGLDAVVTQLLGQLENSGPPPLPRDQIQAIPNDKITSSQVEANMSCSVCWDNFTLGETVSRLECEHIFHPGCITPWLQLHATCPICRRSLISETAAAQAAADIFITPASSSTNTTQTEPRDTTRGYSRVVVRHVAPRRRRAPPPAPHAPHAPHAPRSAAGSESSSSSRDVWSSLMELATAARTPSHSASSVSSDAMYMDIDFD